MNARVYCSTSECICFSTLTLSRLHDKSAAPPLLFPVISVSPSLEKHFNLTLGVKYFFLCFFYFTIN